MPRGTKSETGEKLSVRVTILITESLKADYTVMCEAIKANQSEHIRTMMEAEVALWKASKA